MARESLGTTLWSLMDSLGAVRCALERNAQRGNWTSTLCATWKLDLYIMRNVKKRRPLT